MEYKKNMLISVILLGCKTIYWAVRQSCCLQKSIAYAIRRKYRISNGKAARGLHVSHTNRANIIERDLTMQCDNTINEIWSNQNVMIFIS